MIGGVERAASMRGGPAVRPARLPRPGLLWSALLHGAGLLALLSAAAPPTARSLPPVEFLPQPADPDVPPTQPAAGDPPAALSPPAPDPDLMMQRLPDPVAPPPDVPDLALSEPPPTIASPPVPPSVVVPPPQAAAMQEMPRPPLAEPAKPAAPARRPPAPAPPRPKPAPATAVAAPQPVAKDAPAPGGSPTGASAAPPAASAEPALSEAYMGLLSTGVRRHHRYPEAARWRGNEGVPVVEFRMRRDGVVLAAKLSRSSGDAALDAAALAAVRNASPLPALPADYPAAERDFRMPMRFTLR